MVLLPLSSTATENTLAAELTRHLDDQILPLWTAATMIDSDGGFTNNLTPSSVPQRENLISQLRALYVCAIAIQRVQEPRRKAALEQRYFTLKAHTAQCFYDASSGLWRNETGSDATRETILSAIYSTYIFSELYRMRKDPTALELARKSFLAMERAWDEKYGGYYCEADPSVREPLKDTGFNIHALLALNSYFRASGDKTAEAHLKKLYGIIIKYFIEPRSGHGYLKLRPDWQYAGNTANDQTLYGHSIEMFWYMMDAADTLQCNDGTFDQWLRKGNAALLREVITKEGAVKCLGDFKGIPEKDEVHFWCQAEAMIFLMKMYRRTRDKIYLEAFERVWKWTRENVVAPANGQWHLIVDFKGRTVNGNFAGASWRAGFHETRMLHEVLKELAVLAVSPKRP